MTGTKRCASRKSEEGYKKVESCEEEELEPSGAAASAAPVGIEEREEVKEEENKPLPEQPLPTESTEAADQAADSTTAVDQTAETKEEKEEVVEGPQEEEEPEQDPTVEPEAEAAASAARPQGGRVIADLITSPTGIKTGWEIRGTNAKYTPAKIDPKAP